MATRNPHLQTRSQYGHYWGVYASAGDLPNVFPVIPPTNLLEPLEQGDIAYVQGAGFYQCDFAGVPPDGAAVWSAIAGPGSQDRFAPTFLVGNTAEGDSNVPYNLGGFQYFPDSGNGAELANALAAVTVAGATVYIRRGLYDLSLAGAPASPLVVLANTTVQGEGISATRILGRPTANQGIFQISNANVALRDLSVAVPASDAASLGSDALILVSESAVELHRLTVGLQTAAGGQLREGIRVDGTGGQGLLVTLTDVGIVSNSTTGAGSPTICLRTINTDRSVECRNVRTFGGDIGIRAATPIVIWGSQLIDWSLFGIQQTGTTPVRCYSSRLQALGASGAAAVGAEMEGDGLDFSGVSIRTTGFAHAAAIRVNRPTNVSSDITLRSVTCEGFDYGLELGSAVDVSGVVRALVENCIVQSHRYGAFVSSQSDTVKIAHSTFSVAAAGTGPVFAGIEVDVGANDALLDGNTIVISDLLNAARGIRHQGRGMTVHNRVTFSGCSWGIEIDGVDADCSHNTIIGDGNNISGSQGALHLANQERIRAIGNICDFQQPAYTNPAILVDGTLAQCSMNTTRVTTGVSSPGIRLSATSANCNAIGNICQGTLLPASIVDDLGTGNNVAQNIGAL